MFWKLLPFIFLASGFFLGKPYALLFFGIEEGKNRKVFFPLSIFLTMVIFTWVLFTWLVFSTDIDFTNFGEAIMGIGIVISLPLIIFLICMLCRKSAKKNRAIQRALEEEEARQRERDAAMIEEYEKKKKAAFSQEKEEEHAALLARISEIPGAMNFCDTAEAMNSVAEILNAFKEMFGSIDNFYIREMTAILEQANHYDRLYGNMKATVCKQLRAFFKHDMRIFYVDRKGDTVTCPVCEKQQNTKAQICFNCGALFRD